MGEIGAGDADAIVRHPDSVGVVNFLAADLHPQSGVGILLEGVFHEIEQDLGPIKPVTV